jgi:hypothetical protein
LFISLMAPHLRYLRITWTVFCGIACVLLIALWARSYWWMDGVIAPLSKSTTLVMSSGGGVLGVWINDAASINIPWQFHSQSRQTMLDKIGSRKIRPPEFGISYRHLELPHGLFVLAAAVLATLPWVRRFSLRTLLIAMTLVAVVLGAIVYATRH